MSPRLLLLSFILATSGCSQLYTGRSYLSEMEHDDSTFFSPEEDFPVMAGDNGKFGYTLEDYRDRTPASIEEVEADRINHTLKAELRILEEQQTEGNLRLYQKHKHQLATTSEKIYFLQLPSYERTDYLESRGFLQAVRAPASSPLDNVFRNRNGHLDLGMSKDDVLSSWGKPARVEVAGNPSNENERWAYLVNGATKYIYFESGEVQGWE